MTQCHTDLIQSFSETCHFVLCIMMDSSTYRSGTGLSGWFLPFPVSGLSKHRLALCVTRETGLFISRDLTVYL